MLRRSDVERRERRYREAMERLRELSDQLTEELDRYEAETEEAARVVRDTQRDT